MHDLDDRGFVGMVLSFEVADGELTQVGQAVSLLQGSNGPPLGPLPAGAMLS